MRVCVSVECGASKQRHTLSMSQPSKSAFAESASGITAVLASEMMAQTMNVVQMISAHMEKGKSNEIRNN